MKNRKRPRGAQAVICQVWELVKAALHVVGNIVGLAAAAYVIFRVADFIASRYFELTG